MRFVGRISYLICATPRLHYCLVCSLWWNLVRTSKIQHQQCRADCCNPLIRRPLQFWHQPGRCQVYPHLFLPSREIRQHLGIDMGEIFVFEAPQFELLGVTSVQVWFVPLDSIIDSDFGLLILAWSSSSILETAVVNCGQGGMLWFQHWNLSV